MKFTSLLLMGFAPLPILALDVNAYEILMFYDMYRADHEQNGSKRQIAKACDDCDFQEFVVHLDRLNAATNFQASFADIKSPHADEILDWEHAGTFVYDAKKLLGGLWRDEDSSSRPGHPTVIERLVDRTNQIRLTAEPGRMDRLVETMEIASLSRRKAQAKDLINFVDGRLKAERLGNVKTQSIGFFEGGEFDEFDSSATIESVQRTKKAAMRKEIISIAKDINSGNVKRKRGISDSQFEAESTIVKRAFGDSMAVMSLQRGLDSFRQPVRRKC
ncbi:hypothetical protein ACHAQA_007551 [Verticillium albo-atrum]